MTSRYLRRPKTNGRFTWKRGHQGDSELWKPPFSSSRFYMISFQGVYNILLASPVMSTPREVDTTSPADLKALLIVFSFDTGMREGHRRLSSEIQAAMEKGVWPNQKLGAQTKEGDWRKEGQARTWQKVQVLQSCDWTRAWRNCWECQAMCNALSRVFARWWWRCCCGPLWDGSLAYRYASRC